MIEDALHRRAESRRSDEPGYISRTTIKAINGVEIKANFNVSPMVVSDS